MPPSPRRPLYQALAVAFQARISDFQTPPRWSTQVSKDQDADYATEDGSLSIERWGSCYGYMGMAAGRRYRKYRKCGSRESGHVHFPIVPSGTSLTVFKQPSSIAINQASSPHLHESKLCQLSSVPWLQRMHHSRRRILKPSLLRQRRIKQAPTARSLIQSIKPSSLESTSEPQPMTSTSAPRMMSGKWSGIIAMGFP